MGSGGHGRRCATTSAVRSTRRAGASSIPPVEADAPNVVWAIDFQFDSTVDSKAIKIASMIDEHTREPLLHVVERSTTAERLVVELEGAFETPGGPPTVLRMDNGRELVCPVLQRFCDDRVGLFYIPPGTRRRFVRRQPVSSRLGHAERLRSTE